MDRVLYKNRLAVTNVWQEEDIDDEIDEDEEADIELDNADDDIFEVTESLPRAEMESRQEDGTDNDLGVALQEPITIPLQGTGQNEMDPYANQMTFGVRRLTDALNNVVFQVDPIFLTHVKTYIYIYI